MNGRGFLRLSENTMSPAAENVIERLDGARQKWWLFSLLSTTVLASSLSFGIFLAMMLANPSCAAR